MLGDQPEVLDGVSGLLLAHRPHAREATDDDTPSGGAVGAQMRVESLNFACPTGLYVPPPQVRVGYPRAGSAINMRAFYRGDFVSSHRTPGGEVSLHPGQVLGGHCRHGGPVMASPLLRCEAALNRRQPHHQGVGPCWPHRRTPAPPAPPGRGHVVEAVALQLVGDPGQLGDQRVHLTGRPVLRCR